MTRREYPVRITCAEGGCRESVTYRHERRSDEAERLKWQRDHPWKCTCHEHPEAWLRPGNESTTHVLVASRIPDDRLRGGYLSGLYWLTDGEGHGSGLASGPGFTADADGFPERTRLVVTTKIEMPGADPAEGSRP